VVNKKLVRTSNGRTLSIENTNLLMPFREKIGFYCENHTTDTNAICSRMQSFCDVAAIFQEPGTWTYPEPDEKSPHHLTLFL
jgi:hypothetical protein